MLISRLVILNILLIVAGQSTGVSQDARTDDRLLVDGLVQRRLYSLAESICRQELKQQAINSLSQAEWTVDLIKVQSALAADSAIDSRPQRWADVQKTATDFLDFYPDQPFKILVQVQSALASLTRGQLIRQEVELGMQPETANEQATLQLRNAIQSFDEAERLIQQLVPRAPRVSEEGQMTQLELQNLRTNLTFQKAVCNIDRALLMKNAERLDRLDLLRRALEDLEQIARSTSPEQNLWWSGQIELARFSRIQGDLSNAFSRLDSMIEESIPASLRASVAQEKIRVMLQAGNLSGLAQEYNRAQSIAFGHPKLELALIEAAIFLSKKSGQSESEQQKWQQHALDRAKRVETSQGIYWGRRANLLLASLLGSSVDPENSTGPLAGTAELGDAQLLIKVGMEAERNQQWNDAVEAYDKAADLYRGANERESYVNVAMRSALILQKFQKHQEATQRFQSICQAFPQSSEAPRANLLAIWNQSQMIADDPEQLDAYKNSLDQHLDRFGSHESADQVRVWRSRILARDKRYRDAVRDLLQVMPQSVYFSDAMAQLGPILNAAINESSEGKSSFVLEIIGLLESKLGDEPNQLPETWTPATREVALLLVRTSLQNLKSPPRLLNRMLQAAWDSADDSESRWKSVGAAWLVVTLALRPDQRDQVQFHLEKISEPAAWGELATGLDALSQLYTDDESQGLLAETWLIAHESLQKQFAGLDDKQKLRWALAHAQALQTSSSHEQAIKELEQLAVMHPNQAAVQVAYARVLSDGNDAATWEKGIGRWRRIASRSKANSPRWFEAKYHVALLLLKTGKKEDARKLLEYIKVIGAGWDKSQLKTQFDELYLRCSS